MHLRQRAGHDTHTPHTLCSVVTNTRHVFQGSRALQTAAVRPCFWRQKHFFPSLHHHHPQSTTAVVTTRTYCDSTTYQLPNQHHQVHRAGVIPCLRPLVAQQPSLLTSRRQPQNPRQAANCQCSRRAAGRHTLFMPCVATGDPSCSRFLFRRVDDPVQLC